MADSDRYSKAILTKISQSKKNGVNWFPLVLGISCIPLEISSLADSSGMHYIWSAQVYAELRLFKYGKG